MGRATNTERILFQENHAPALVTRYEEAIGLLNDQIEVYPRHFIFCPNLACVHYGCRLLTGKLFLIQGLSVGQVFVLGGIHETQICF